MNVLLELELCHLKWSTWLVKLFSVGLFLQFNDNYSTGAVFIDVSLEQRNRKLPLLKTLELSGLVIWGFHWQMAHIP